MFTWQILDVDAKDGLITSARYMVTLADGESGSTEGNWYFVNPKMTVPFDQVTEEMVASWIEKEAVKDGKHLIKDRLAEQLESLKNTSVVVAPWKPQTFTV